MEKHITTPITAEVTRDLHAGDYVYISGIIYVARDAAHKRFMETLDQGDKLSRSEEHTSELQSQR